MSRFMIAWLYVVYAFVTKRRTFRTSTKLLFAFAALLSTPGYAAINHFLHIVVVFQENRTPDNLFWHLCDQSSVGCSTSDDNKFDILPSGWLTQDANGHTVSITPEPVLLSNCNQDSGTLTGCWDMSHKHDAFLAMCDKNLVTGACRMDGAGNEQCSGACPLQRPFYYVDDLTTIQPYLYLATNYGWANKMFQTNEGPSFPAHQFIFGASSAPSQTDDANGNFAAENMHNTQGCSDTSDGEPGCIAGCIAASDTQVYVINAAGIEYTSIPPCFERQTISDLLESNNVTWTYYANKEGSIWDAPNAISHICGAQNGHCQGSDFTSHVVADPGKVLVDAAWPNCHLANVSWVIPDGSNSDHPTSGSGGPDWVASIVNTIGNSKCTDGGTNGPTYWEDTAIVVAWDDWGGWYDHESPQFQRYPWSSYQYGFRVPLIFVSAYGINNNGGSTCLPSINNNQLDFGSVARFIEGNFSLGSLGFADARSVNDLSGFYNINQTACSFGPVPAHRNAHWFLTHKLPPTPPDTD